MSKTVLITGCSSGFGKLAVNTFQAKGWNVIATMRSPEKETELTQLKNVIVEKLDVTDVDSISSAVKKGIIKFGSIDALVNNAGYGGYGLFEQYSDRDIRNMYETNVFGPMNVMREVLPIMREQEAGTIINVASLVGIFGSPNAAVYSSTKFAIKGLSEAMALELKPLNIKVHTVCPGGFETNFNVVADVNFQNGDEELVNHAQVLAGCLVEARKAFEQPGMEADPQEVADIIYQCATEEMPIHNMAGADAVWTEQMRSSLPDQEFLDKMGEMLLPPAK
ncbi:MAG: SDR family oxidoreductase [Carboxylicivirga sp.]|jgi:NAD(P)-dependent dehydrogenase (short-subunit alcohol dehydrogenase family)|nr:SDR family oxidoreductase [Carboxylicivirga sp.]